MFFPIVGYCQYVHYHHYPSDSVAEQITKGNVKNYCMDTVELVIEKNDDNKKSKQILPQDAAIMVNEILSKGTPVYGGRGNMGYSFSIFVYHRKDEMKIYRLISFKVDQTHEKIYKIIISKQI